MRRFAPSSVSVLAVVLFALPNHASAQDGETKVVSVNVTCPENLETEAVQISISPWVVAITKNDEIDWDLTMTALGSDPNDYIEIAAKSSSKWPFDKTKDKKQKKVKSGKVKDKTKDGDYFYTITVTCDSDSVVIDPRVRVGGGGGG